VIKIIFSFVLILSSALIGNSFSQKLINRRKTLTSLVGAISRIKTLICFGGEDISLIIKKCLCTEDFPLMNASVFDEYKEFDKSFLKGVKSINTKFSLTNSDKELLMQFGSLLGTTDIQGQIAHTELYSCLFTEKLNKVKEQESSKTNLYRVLGFSLGCVISLLIV